MLERRHAQGAAGQDDIRRERNQFRCEFAIEVDIVCTPSDVDPHIAVGPARLSQDLLKRCDEGLTFWIVLSHVHKHADPPHLLGFLRACSQRPCDSCATQNRYEPSSSNANYHLTRPQWDHAGCNIETISRPEMEVWVVIRGPIMLQCMSLLLAQSGRAVPLRSCPLSGVNRTSQFGFPAATNDPNRVSPLLEVRGFCR